MAKYELRQTTTYHHQTVPYHFADTRDLATSGSAPVFADEVEVKIGAPTLTNPELFNQIESLAINKADAELPYRTRLARENMWATPFANRVCAEYRKFLYLAAISSDEVTPSEVVDAAWHLHLVYTQSYWDDLCAGIFKRPLHHVPSKGGGQQLAYYKERYASTLLVYAQEFGEPPPADIWPSVERRFHNVRQTRNVDAARYWIIRKPGTFIYLLLGVVFFVLGSAFMVLGWHDYGAAIHTMLPAAIFLAGLASVSAGAAAAAQVYYGANPDSNKSNSGGSGIGCGCGGDGCGGGCGG